MLPPPIRKVMKLVSAEILKFADDHVRGQKLDEYTDLIMRSIAELLPEQYRGAYA